MLGFGSYHVVVGNPPYITVKDKQENRAYRKAYPSCHREYSLAVPFAERFFQLAIHGDSHDRHAGYVGQITANSFMKREFGQKLIEEFFPTVDLTHVIDMLKFIARFWNAAVTLIGPLRILWPGSTVRVALRIRGERAQPDDPAKGYVWQAIIHQIDRPGSASEWISVVDISRDRLAKHPWSLSGGGALELRNSIESRQARTLSDAASSIGYGAISGEDDAFILPDLATARRLRADAISRLVSGDAVRDHQISSVLVTAWPYDDEFQRCEPRAIPGTLEFLWPYRRTLEIRRRFGILVERIKELKWYDYRELYSSKLRQRSPSAAFAEIATHNHFCIHRYSAVFNQTAPLIIFPDSFDADHSAVLLGVLNSSLACFWLKEVCHVKGGSGIGRRRSR